MLIIGMSAKMLTIARIAITREAINPQCICTPAFDGWYACTSVHIHRSIYHDSCCHAERGEEQTRVLQGLLTHAHARTLSILPRRAVRGAGSKIRRPDRAQLMVRAKNCEFWLPLQSGRASALGLSRPACVISRFFRGAILTDQPPDPTGFRPSRRCSAYRSR